MNKWVIFAFLLWCINISHAQTRLSLTASAKVGGTITDISYKPEQVKPYNLPVSGSGFVLTLGGGVRYKVWKNLSVSLVPSYAFLSNSMRLKRMDAPIADRHVEWNNHLDIPILVSYSGAAGKKYIPEVHLGYGIGLYHPSGSDNIFPGGGIEDQYQEYTRYAQDEIIRQLYIGGGIAQRIHDRHYLYYGIQYRKGYGIYIKGDILNYENGNLVYDYSYAARGDYLAFEVAYRFGLGKNKEK